MCLKCIPTNNLRDKYLGDLPPIFKDAILQLYDGKITPEQLHGGLLQLIAQELWQGVSIGFDTDLSKHDEQSQHYRMVKALRTNVYVFSGFKTYQQLKEASLLMVDADGNIKPFTQFLKDVQGINKNYNVNYLRAEYDNALVSAQMAAKWEDFEALANDFPLLKFVATIDDRTTAICESLNGLTKPFDWPGWNKYMLPLHWGERSNIIQIADGDISDVNETDLPEPPKMFANNVGKTGIIFPETHPYFDVKKGTADVIKSNSLNELKSQEYYDILNNDTENGIGDTIERIGSKKLPPVYDALNDIEKSAIRHYTGTDGYEQLNKYLFNKIRAVEPNEFYDAFEHVLNNALDKLDTKFEGIVMRGAELTDDVLSQYERAFLKDKEVTHLAFTSTSMDSGFPDVNTHFTIKSKTGRIIQDIAYIKQEKEVLFKSNTKFKVTGFVREGNAAFIEMEEI